MSPEEILRRMLPYLEAGKVVLAKAHEGHNSTNCLFLCLAVCVAHEHSKVKDPDAEWNFRRLVEYRMEGRGSYRTWLKECRYEQTKHLEVRNYLPVATVQQGRHEWLEDLIAEAKGLPRRVEGTLPIPERHP